MFIIKQISQYLLVIVIYCRRDRNDIDVLPKPPNGLDTLPAGGPNHRRRRKKVATAINKMLYMLFFTAGLISLTNVVVCTDSSVVSELVNISLTHRMATYGRARCVGSIRLYRHMI